jgi:hypothetical protein
MKYVATLLAGLAIGVGGTVAVQAATDDAKPEGWGVIYAECMNAIPDNPLDLPLYQGPTTSEGCERRADRALD